MSSLENKVILITGGGTGIGRAAALQFAAEGAQVIVTGRRAEPLQSLAELDHAITYTIADAASAEDASRTVNDAVERFGRLDALINNAGAGAVLPLSDATLEHIQRIFSVNVFGPSMLAAAAIPSLKASGGSIVNISSTFGHKAAAALSHYAASKAAIEHLTRCWALELAPVGVRVNAIAPGPTETDFLIDRMGLSAEQSEAIKSAERRQIPMRRRGAVEDVAHWIVALASPSAAWVTGQIVTIDGGLSIT